MPTESERVNRATKPCEATVATIGLGFDRGTGLKKSSQCRLFLTADQETANRIATKLDAAFEDDGYPIATVELDQFTKTWSISVYVPELYAENLSAKVSDILLQLGLALPVECERLGDADWVAQSLEGLTPVYAGRFTVSGSHHAPPLWPHSRSIMIDAGQAFGTGHHGTTAACLDLLDACFRQRRYRNVLDLGTGTGVLAIAVAKSVPATILASDIDPLATRIAAANARANGVSTRIAHVTAAGLSHRGFRERGPFDLVCANILAGPLAAMARDLTRCLSVRATVILSGLLPHQRARIISAYRSHGLALRRSHLRDGWLALVFETRPNSLPLGIARDRYREKRRPGLA